MSAPARTSVRRAMNRNEPERVQIDRHVRYVAADPVLVRYHREREARLLEEAAVAVQAEHGHEAAATVRRIAARHRRGDTPSWP